MASKLPGALSRRPTTLLRCGSTPTPAACPSVATTHTSYTPLSHTPSRHATIIRRPRRPYTFTQLVQLSDGSTYTMRTTSPVALYKATKDTRNHVLWQPSEKSLRNVEVDEAGRLAAFRGRFGRGWDADKTPDADEVEAAIREEGPAAGVEGTKGDVAPTAAPKQTKKEDGGSGDSLGDLISSYSTGEELPMKERPQRKKK